MHTYLNTHAYILKSNTKYTHTQSDAVDKKSKSGIRQHTDMTGRRVLVDAAYFGIPHDDPYPGLVHQWTSYRNEQNKKLWGYDVHYDDGDEYYMLEKDVLRFLVPKTKSSLGIYPTPISLQSFMHQTRLLTNTPSNIYRCCR